jgi:hypothetical protein
MAALATAALASLAAAQPTGPGRPGSWKVDTFIVLYMECAASPCTHAAHPTHSSYAGRRAQEPTVRPLFRVHGPARRGQRRAARAERPQWYHGQRDLRHSAVRLRWRHGLDTWASKFAGGCGLDSPSGSCNPNLYPYSEQSDDFSVANGAKAGTTAVKMFSPEQIPVKVCVCVRERVSVCESVCVRARAPVPVPMSQCLTVCLAVGLDCQRIRRLQ